MCRSTAEGGQRCAAHTRPRYQAATFGTDEWDQAAANYASTREGRAALLQSYNAERDVERSVALFGAISRGANQREAHQEIAAQVAEAGVPHISSEAGTNHVYWNQQGSGWITTHSLTNARRDAARSGNASRAATLEVAARMSAGTLEQPSVGGVQGSVKITHNGAGEGFTVENRDLKCTCADYQANYDCEHVRNTVAEITERINQERVGRRHVGTVLRSQIEEIFARQANATEVDLGESEVDYRTDFAAFEDMYNRGSQGEALEYLAEDATGGLGSPDGGRGFGVELEFVGGDTDAIAQDLYDAGLIPRPRQEHYHSDPTVRMAHSQGWKFERDCTVTGEIISPVMYDTPETWENLSQVCDIVERNGGTASVRAGSHIHISSGNYGSDASRYTRLLGMFHENEDSIYRLAANPETGEHRMNHGSSWCSPNPVPSSGFTSVGTLWSASSHSNAVNFGAVGGRPGDNVEFRMWDATLKPSVIQTQIVASLAMTEAAYRNDGHVHGARTAIGTTGRQSANTTLDAQTTGFRSFVDRIARRKVDKDRIVKLFASNKWQ